MDTRNITTYLHPYQKRAIELDHRFCLWRWGRQTGKSHAISLRRIIRGVHRRRDQIFLSAGAEQSRELMDKARSHVAALKLACNWTEHDEDELLEDGRTRHRSRVLQLHIPQAGIRITGRPANPRTARGWTGDVLLDEFAMLQFDREIWGAVFPAVTRSGGEVDIASTPWGRSNVFARLHGNPLFHTDVVTIHQAVADGLDADPATLRAGIADELLWRQEFLCEFVDEASAFLTYELIARCEDATLERDLDLEGLRMHKGHVFVGVDVGRERHPTVIWAFDRTGDRLTHIGIVGLVGKTFRTQFELLSDILACQCVRGAAIDATGLGRQLAEELVERFGSKVEGLHFTQQLKEDLAGRVLIKMQDANVRIPRCDKIREDLHSVERRVTPGGHVQFRAPSGREHADRFWSLALACHAADTGYGPLTFGVGPSHALGYRGGEKRWI